MVLSCTGVVTNVLFTRLPYCKTLGTIELTQATYNFDSTTVRDPLTICFNMFKLKITHSGKLLEHVTETSSVIKSFPVNKLNHPWPSTRVVLNYKGLTLGIAYNDIVVYRAVWVAKGLKADSTVRRTFFEDSGLHSIKLVVWLAVGRVIHVIFTIGSSLMHKFASSSQWLV